MDPDTDSDEQKRHWAEHPLEYQDYCKDIESELNQRFKFILNGSPAAEEAKQFSVQQMQQKLGGRTDIADKLIPKEFGVGCRRPTVDTGSILPWYLLDTDRDLLFSRGTVFSSPWGFPTSMRSPMYRAESLAMASSTTTGTNMPSIS